MNKGINQRGEFMELYEIVMKLVGPVQPVGETNIDARRLENMKELTQLVDQLLGQIENASRYADKAEASVKEIGQHARNFINEVTTGGDL